MHIWTAWQKRGLQTPRADDVVSKSPLVLVRLDHVVRFVVNADHSIM
jgi:hypothetical protein